MSFKKDFVWGVATAAAQIEGAAIEDGRGLSIWDVFAEQPGNVYEGHTPAIACDHYHRLDEDVTLLVGLGIGAYRFSVAWTRIFPNGKGEVSPKGLEFYHRLIDLLLKNNITPYMTLFHWDYPYALETQGGWMNKDSPKWFADYASVIAKEFGDKVKHYITFNEPQCFIGHGYNTGKHAPGHRRTKRDLVLMAHNVMLAHGVAVQAIREAVPDAKIGFAPMARVYIPDTNSPDDINAARQMYFDAGVDNFTNTVTWWSDPVMLGRYPKEATGFSELSKHLPDCWLEDLKTIHQPLDFYGQNIYQGYRCRAGKNGPERVLHKVGMPKNALDWPIVPEAMYWSVNNLYQRYKTPIIITENGMSCHDTVSLDGKVHDPNRIDFTHRYLLALQKASQDGADVRGYFHWSFMDNYEWAEGYKERFGLVYVDFETFKRTPKESYTWYRDMILANGENL